MGVGEDASDAGDNGVGYLENPQAPLERLGSNNDFHGGDYSPTGGSVIDLPIGMTQGYQESQADPRTLEAAYELTVQALDSSSRDISSADTKLIGTFAVATVVIGLLPIIEGVSVFSAWHWPNLFLYSAFLTFIWVVTWVHWGLRGRTIYSLESFEPQVLREHYWHLGEMEFKPVIYSALEDAHRSNRRQLEVKRSAYRRSATAVPFELVFLLIWAFTRGT